MSDIIVPGAPRLLIPERHRADKKMVDYNERDVGGMTPDEVSVADIEMHMAKRIGAKLMATYPNRQWGVYVNAAGGIVQITCPSLSNEKGYILHIKKGESLHDLQDKAVKAAGEVLERYGISRGRVFNPDALEQLNRDAFDEAVTADSAPDKKVGSLR